MKLRRQLVIAASECAVARGSGRPTGPCFDGRFMALATLPVAREVERND